VNGVPVTVVGVAPAGFAGLQTVPTPDIWVPAAAHQGSAQLGFRPMGRLKPGVSVEQARAQMRLLDRARVEELAPAGNDPQWRQVNLDVEPAGAGFSTPFHEQFGRPLLVIMAVVAALLLMACTTSPACCWPARRLASGKWQCACRLERAGSGWSGRC
jgi:hypothetical protein